MVCHLIFLLHKGFEAWFLEWKPSPENPLNNPNRNNNSNPEEDSVLLKLILHNYFPYLGLFWLVDHKNIYTTMFEVMVFFIVYTYHSFVLATKETISDYIKKVYSYIIQIYTIMILIYYYLIDN